MTLRIVSFLALAWAIQVQFLDAQALNRKPFKSIGHPRALATSTDPFQRDTDSPNLVEGRELSQPQALAVDTSVTPFIVYVADTGNNRVLAWKNAGQFVNGAFADLVIGQKDRFSTLPQGPGQVLASGLNSPAGLAVDRNGNLYVADTGNNRVLRYPAPFSQPDDYKTPDMVIGQLNLGINVANAGGITEKTLALNLGSQKTGLAFDPAGNLWVSDSANNRVLRYRSTDLASGQNGPSADLVLGQADFVSRFIGAGRFSRTGLSGPAGLTVDDKSRVYVADRFQRIVVYDNLRTGASAVRILGVQTQVPGQPPPPPINEASIGGVDSPPQGVFMMGARPAVLDTGNNRILIYDSPEVWPTEEAAFSPSARTVFGQETFLTGRPNRGDPASLQRTPSPTANSLLFPYDAVQAGEEVFIADALNNRVIVAPVTAPGVIGAATRVLGQFGFIYGAPNLIEGREFSSPGAVAVDTLSKPQRLYVADTRNNRVLGFADFARYRPGDRADVIIGQPDFLSSTLNHPGGDASVPSDSGLAQPAGLAVDSSGNLYVADTGNGRVLRFPKPFEQPQATLQRADLVIGQANFTARLIEPSARTMRNPTGLAFTGESGASAADRGALLVSDSALNRVLYFPKPFANGMTATKVIGQPDFTSTSANTDLGRNFNTPRHIAVDSEDRLYVCDSQRGRILIFDSVPALSNLPTPVQTLGQRTIENRQELTQPVGIAIDPRGSIWVADFQPSRVVRFPRFDRLFTNNFSDSTVLAIGPQGLAVDRFGNLLVSDSSHRIQYFVPEIVVTNAANFLTRPLAPGTVVSAVPVNSDLCGPARCDPAPFGTETATFDSQPVPIPLPREIADIQLRVNEQPIGLFFVSPGQINAPLPMSLPSTGTAGVDVYRPSTGQVLGFGDVRLDAASPGLFSVNSSGTGGAASLNEEASCRPEQVFFRCFNSPTNPIARGQVIQLFGTGQGAVDGAPPDGFPATSAIPVQDRTRVSFAGEFVDDADVLYSGLAPGLIGVWQVNARVPQRVTPGSFIPVNVVLRSIGTVTNSTRITIAVK